MATPTATSTTVAATPTGMSTQTVSLSHLAARATTTAAAATSAVSRINLGSLNPDFEAPGSCSSLIVTAASFSTQFNETLRTLFLRQAMTCMPGQGFVVNADCYPSGYAFIYNDLIKEHVKTSTYPVYSPASVCPKGYHTAFGLSRYLTTPTLTSTDSEFGTSTTKSVVKTVTAKDDADLGFLEAGEGAAICCPSYYSVTARDEGFHCISSAFSGSVVFDHDTECATQTHQPTVITGGFGYIYEMIATAAPILIIKTWETPEISTAEASDSPFLPEVTPTGKKSRASRTSTSVDAYLSLVLLCIGLQWPF